MAQLPVSLSDSEGRAAGRGARPGAVHVRWRLVTMTVTPPLPRGQAAQPRLLRLLVTPVARQHIQCLRRRDSLRPGYQRHGAKARD